MKIQYKFMELVANGLYIIMMSQLGYNMNRRVSEWNNYRDEFFTELRKEESKDE